MTEVAAYFPPHSEGDPWLKARESLHGQALSLYERHMQNKHIRTVTVSVPDTVRSSKWVRNHHYVELEDERGATIKLHAGGVLRGVCVDCKEVAFVMTEQGAMVCPHCTGKMKWAWNKLQLAFLPEEESRFRGFDAEGLTKRPLTRWQRAWLILYSAVTRNPPKASSAPKDDPTQDLPVFPVPLGDDEETPAPGIEPRAKG